MKRKSVHTPKFAVSIHMSSLSKKSFTNSLGFVLSKFCAYKSLYGLPRIFLAGSFYFTVKLYSVATLLMVRVYWSGPTVYVPSRIFLRVLSRTGDILLTISSLSSSSSTFLPAFVTSKKLIESSF
jgi:hypothetical protein